MIPVKILAVRYLANASPSLGKSLGAPAGYPSLGLLTTDSDDATYIALDEATKAADVKLCKLYSPPSETNFGGGLLSGTQSACDAACAAFAEAVQDVARMPR